MGSAPITDSNQATVVAEVASDSAELQTEVPPTIEFQAEKNETIDNAEKE